MKMKLLLGLLVTSALCGSAYAADQAPPLLKAPAITHIGFPGWYLLVGTEAAVAQANVSGNNFFATGLVGGNLKAAGGAVKVGFGYITPKWRFESSVAYQNITGDVTTAGGSASVASRWRASQEVDVNFSFFQNILTALNSGLNTTGGVFPSFTPILPSNIASTVAAMPRQYVGAGVREFGLDGSFGVANGATVSWGPMIKTGFIYQQVDLNGKSTGNSWDAYAWVSWPTKGFTLNNVLASNGTPLTIGGAASMGTQYGAGLNFGFSPYGS
jgi:hypothetical protein